MGGANGIQTETKEPNYFKRITQPHGRGKWEGELPQVIFEHSILTTMRLKTKGTTPNNEATVVSNTVF